MNQTVEITKALKKYLKSHGITYKELARRLSISEVSVKRIFSKSNFTIARLEHICSALQLTIHDVVSMAHNSAKNLESFTSEQEKFLAEYPKVLALFYLLAAQQTPEKILRYYDFNKHELNRMLLQLDRLGLIVLSPNNKYKLRATVNVRWDSGGLLMNRYFEQIKVEYFQRPFQGKNDFLQMVHGNLSESAVKTLRKNLERTLADFRQLSDSDSPMAKDAKRVTLVLAFRPWSLSLFDQYRKKL